MRKTTRMHAKMVARTDSSIAKDQGETEQAIWEATSLTFDALVRLDHLGSDLGWEAPVVAVRVVPVVHQRCDPPATDPPRQPTFKDPAACASEVQQWQAMLCPLDT